MVSPGWKLGSTGWYVQPLGTITHLSIRAPTELYHDRGIKTENVASFEQFKKCTIDVVVHTAFTFVRLGLPIIV
jgi:hypothetical protein